MRLLLGGAGLTLVCAHCIQHIAQPSDSGYGNPIHRQAFDLQGTKHDVAW